MELDWKDVNVDLNIPTVFYPNSYFCRGCLSNDKQVKCFSLYRSYYQELLNVVVSDSDASRQWLCIECAAMLVKCVSIKKKLLKCHNILMDHFLRLGPVGMESWDLDLTKFRSPLLSQTNILQTDNEREKNGFHRVLYHKKMFGLPDVISVDITTSDIERIFKSELDSSDFDDDMPLEEYKTNKPMPDLELSSVLDVLDFKQDITIEEEPLYKELPKKKVRKLVEKKNIRKSENEPKDTEPKDTESKDTEDEPEQKVDVKVKTKRRSIRRPIELDPEKIAIITLDPVEQVRQREAESKAEGLHKFPFKCKLCYRGFNYETKLQNHMKKHDPSRGKWECKLCSMYLPTAYSYRVHELTHTQRFECRACGKRMTDRGSIMDHYRAHHDHAPNAYTCQLCGKLSLNSRTHRGHMRNHHSGERPRCDQCGKTFVNRDSLNEHILIHQGVKAHECTQCGMRFRTKTQARHHQLKHSSTRDFYCVECDVRFKSAHNLRQHLLKTRVHVSSGALGYACAVAGCTRRYGSEPALRHHVAFQHQGLRLHACDTCGVALATRNSLLKHRRTAHEGFRPPAKHVCATCGRAFRGKNVLDNHMRTHTGEKPFDCTFCGRKFAQRTAMRTHIKRVHLKLKRNEKLKEGVMIGECKQEQPWPVALLETLSQPQSQSQPPQSQSQPPQSQSQPPPLPTHSAAATLH